MSGDGLAMAWRAGATLVNLEMQWWHTNDVAHPPSWQRMQIYPNPVLGSEASARMVNAEPPRPPAPEPTPPDQRPGAG